MQWTEEEATTEAERGSEPGIAPAVSRPTLESLRDFEHVGHESSRVLHPSTSILELNCEMTFGGSGLRREPKCVKQKAVTEPSCIAALASNRDRLVQETLDGLPSAGRSSARGGPVREQILRVLWMRASGCLRLLSHKRRNCNCSSAVTTKEIHRDER